MHRTIDLDHFEGIVKTVLETEGYWVRQSFKVSLSKDAKKLIGKHSMPRPELDLLAFRPVTNSVLVVEVKSYFDSPGVRVESLQEEHAVPTGRYKLFTCQNYREIVFARLKQDLVTNRMADDNVTMQLGLVAGNVYQDRDDDLREVLESRGFFFWSSRDIRDKVKALAQQGYENDAAIITAKILAK